MCDETGRRVNSRTILRPPSYAPLAWSEMSDPELRRRAWERFWAGTDPPLPSNAPSAVASRSLLALRTCALHQASLACAPAVGQYVVLTEEDTAESYAALAAIRWKRSPRWYVPGKGFCVGASLNRCGPICTRPDSERKMAAVVALNRLIRARCHDSFCWSSLQLNHNTGA